MFTVRRSLARAASRAAPATAGLPVLARLSLSRAIPGPAPLLRQLPVLTPFRSYSVLSQSVAKVWKYNDIKELVSNPEKHKETVLIDVREPVEFKEGHIPGALNVPFKSSPGALDMSEEDFEESFGFPKPSKESNLVFYCLGGVRSTAAEELANSFGYEKRGNYIGSYEDWVAHEIK